MGYYSDTIRVVGVTIGDRQSVVAALAENEWLDIRREPENPADPNACAVWTRAAESQQVGYVPRLEAERLAPLIDSGWKVYALVSKVYPATRGSAAGVRVTLRGVAPRP